MNPSENPIWARLLDEAVIRPIDYHFANWLGMTSNASESPQMLAALVSRLLGDGHICVRLDRIASVISEWPTSVQPELRRLLPSDTLSAKALIDQTVIGDGRALTPLVLSEDRFYLYQYFQYERQVAHALSVRAELDHTLTDAHMAMLACTADQLFKADESPDWQKVAACNAVMNRLAVISGGPGTGKTTTVTKLLAMYLTLERDKRLADGNEHWPVIQLAAPTGKAAARLSESIAGAKESLPLDAGLKAHIPAQGQTLHRLLGVRPNNNQVKYHRDNPLHLDLLVVDEASMIDLPLMAKLLDALPPHAKLILIGDRYQLASVEAGSVMGDLCDQPEVVVKSSSLQKRLADLCQVDLREGLEKPMANAVSFLKKSYRFRDDSGIGALAFAVNQGNLPALKTALSGQYDDVDWVPDTSDTPDALLDHMLKQYTPFFECVQKGAQASLVLETFNQFRLLTGMRRGRFGVESLNEAFEERLLKARAITPNGRWYSGRAVMITRNEPSLSLYNGDVGVALLDETSGKIRVWFDLGGTLKSFSTSRLPQHEPVFAMTVHKSQGSEFDQVTLLLHGAGRGLSRELVYTGITRAKKRCLLWGDKAVLVKSAQSPTIRMSGLSDRLWQ
jgi:exodeoxyribonuclease V alpha subunit